MSRPLAREAPSPAGCGGPRARPALDPRRRAVLLGLGGGLALWLGAGHVEAQLRPTFDHGIVENPPRPLPDLVLVDPDGGPVRFADYRGRWLWVFFGFTHCPDVCPTALAEAAREYRTLGANVTTLQVLFISLDPARDTAARLGPYVRYFHPTFAGLTGTEASVAAAARAFGVRYRRRDTRL